MRHKLLTFTALVLTAFSGLATEPARQFSHPDRIHYDSHCLTIDGKDIFIYSGAFHYFRCPKELWRARFQKIREAGFNAVETYAPWNWHETQMPSDLEDFSKVDMTDLDDWLTMAESFGFYIIVRPGPYICAEWDSGGYPQWLLTKKPAKPLLDQCWLRSDEPTYLAWCKHWYDAVCPVIAAHQLTRKAPGKTGVILVQMENEYDYPRLSDEIKNNQVKALIQAARDNGIDVPLMTCLTHPVRGQSDPLLRQVFDSCNFYPRWDVDSIKKKMDQLRNEQPDAPLMTTELQAGWFAQVGGKLSEDQDGVTASQINNLTLFAIQNGDTLMNYYMLFGGTNPGDWAARDLITSYDYNAPIRECGGVGDRYQRVWALGHMLREHGAKLARAEIVKCDVTVSQKDVTVVLRRAQNGSRYLFIRTSQHKESREGDARVKEKSGAEATIKFHYNLEPFGSAVLYLPPGVTKAEKGEWLPKPAPTIERSTDLPDKVVIASARRRDDPGPSSWSKLKANENLPQAGIYDNRFIFYRIKIVTTTDTNLTLEYPEGDTALATINGNPVTTSGGTLSSAVFALPAGSNQVLMLYENGGHANIGDRLEEANGISTAQLTPDFFASGKPIGGWRMREVDGYAKHPEVKPDFTDDDWKPVDVSPLETDNLPAGHFAVYRARLELTAAELQTGKTILTFGRIDDLGWVYVNGKKIGQTIDWSRSYSFDVTKQLKAGANVIAVIVQNKEGTGGLGKPSLSHKLEGAVVPLESFGTPTGVKKNWWSRSLNDTKWDTIQIGDTTPPHEALLTWYRFNFNLQEPKRDVWVPWRLHLAATGNGFLYLNGHALGRYWQAGPQHDFYLPECWLNFGPQKQNVLTLSLRPTDKGDAIQSAIVEPYAEFAEKR